MNNLSFPKSFGDKDDGERRITWIPVEKGLPKEHGEYLVTTKSLDVYSLFFDGDFIIDPIAWAKLPTPYRNKS